MAEHLTRAGLTARDITGLDVVSAGTHAAVGYPVQEHAAGALGALGIASEAFRARHLDADLVASADLILAASREHRAASVTLAPRSASRTFTLREFDRLLRGAMVRDLPSDTPARAEALVQAAASMRGRVRPERPGDDDIIDPYGGPASGYPPCAALIDSALQYWLNLLDARPVSTVILDETG
jgi:protein-tyrosine phosphatase